MADAPQADYDDQDRAETFDEDNTNVESERHGSKGDAEQFEDLVDVFDSTKAAGDRDDNEAMIGEDLDDEDIVAAARDQDDDDDDLEDDDLAGRDAAAYDSEDDLEDSVDVDGDDPDDVDETDRPDKDEVGLEYAGDLNDVAGAESSAADLESETLSDDDLRELDYKED